MAFIVSDKRKPTRAMKRKITDSPMAETVPAENEANMVPRIMPRKETVSIFPVPKAIRSGPPISLISPYLEGEKRQL